MIDVEKFDNTRFLVNQEDGLHLDSDEFIWFKINEAKTLNVMELDKEALHSIGNEGRKNVSKKFDVEKMCHTTFTQYQKLVK